MDHLQGHNPAKPKYDFIEMKKEFFLSDYNAVLPFLTEKFGPKANKNSTLSKHTVGWAEEKKEWKMEMVERTLDEIQGFEAKENAKALIMIMGALRSKVSTVEKAKNLPIDELQRLWDMFMTMNGKVTRITKELQLSEPEKPFDYSEDAKKRKEKYLCPPEAQEPEAEQKLEE